MRRWVPDAPGEGPNLRRPRQAPYPFRQPEAPLDAIGQRAGVLLLEGVELRFQCLLALGAVLLDLEGHMGEDGAVSKPRRRYIHRLIAARVELHLFGIGAEPFLDLVRLR